MKSVAKEISGDLPNPPEAVSGVMSRIRIGLSVPSQRWTIFFSVRRDMIKEFGR